MKTATLSTFHAGVLLLALALATGTAPVSAWPDDEGRPERMLGKVTRQLDLSPEQQASVAALMAEARSAAAADRARMRELKAELRPDGGTFDAAGARATADELGEITARLSFRMAETRAAVHALLNEEQRAKLQALEAQRGERRHLREQAAGPGT
jgi:Spy/CpxP family protein refolding chaperone